jgi:chromosome partitioning protein
MAPGEDGYQPMGMDDPRNGTDGLADSRPVHRLTFANAKGGAGKTTAAVNLAGAWGAAGKRVLVIDLDPAGSATDWLGGTPSPGLAELLTGERGTLGELVVPTSVPGVSLVPASPILAAADKLLAGEVGVERVLAQSLDTLIPAPDVVVIDTPPALGIVTVSALVAAPAVLVPVQARAMSLAGLASLSRTVERVAERLEPACRIVGIVAGETNRTRLSGEVVRTLTEHFGELVLTPGVPSSTRLAEAPSHHQWIGTYDPGGAAAAAFAVLSGAVWDRLA